MIAQFSSLIPLFLFLGTLLSVYAGPFTPASVSPKTIAIFGSSGQTGRECVVQLLSSGHRVLAFTRHPEKLLYPSGSTPESANKPIEHPNLKVVVGDVKNKEEVLSAFPEGNDIHGVIVALGGRTKDVGATMLTDGTSNIIDAMKSRSQAKRIAVVTSIGAGDSEKNAPWHFKALMYTVMSKMFKDKNNQERLFLNAEGPGHDLDYTIVRPGGLGNGAPTHIVNVNDGVAGSIQRADVAWFCLRAILEDNFAYLKQSPSLSSVSGTGWKKEPEKGFDKPAAELDDQEL